MKIICAVLLVALAGVGWWLRTEVDATRRQAAEIQRLTAKLADKSREEEFKLQQKCATEAQQKFHRLGYSETGVQPQDVLGADYQSHYNTAQNRCFMTLEVTMTGGLQSMGLFDALENRTYAQYDWLPEKDDVSKGFRDCHLTPTSTDDRRCISEQEYRAFVAHYME
ncbi:hypothetical protein AWB69_05967 [Caballeronia udeis]|uniref:Uncharacterized protein n=1 Tax=Caballeronia udeis TaxID=1232866 RepID=A0A158IH46_9BURK|nr:hypothetical protein [Caballeronia udeis]SAL55609.1 hypothetical protein AWB69_05967 [Caballeronia udeis]